MKRVGYLLAGILLWLALSLSDSAFAAEKRVALVIGNSAYRNAPALANPRNDATDIAAMLERLGFKVSTVLDADRDAMEEAVERFSDVVENADVALLYYAGHAMQHEGVNYLMPIDASLQSAAGLRRMTRLNELMADMRRAKGLRMVVLDACRDNPMAERLQTSAVATRSAGLAKLSTRSLAKLSQGNNAAATTGGDIIVYAAEAGRTAADGTGRNSPFTASFLRHADREGQEIVQLMRRVTTDVQEATRGEQRPELSLSVPFEFYFRQGSAPPQASVRQLFPQAKPHEAGAMEKAVDTIVERSAPELREQTRREVMAILADLASRSGLRPDQIAEELAKAHAQVVKLRADIEAFRQITENEPEVADFIELAAAALSSGRRPDRKAADEALAAAQVRYDIAIQRRSTELEKARLRKAELTGKRGDIAISEYRFQDAAKLYRDAVADMPVTEETRYKRASLYLKVGNALYQDGHNFYRNNSMREAIAILETEALPLIEGDTDQDEDAKLHKARSAALALNLIGEVQEALGLRLPGLDGLKLVIEARQTYSKAIDWLNGLSDFASVSVMIDVLDNRANRDTRFGARVGPERGRQQLESAVSVQRFILQLRDKYPALAADKSRTRHNLAFALFEQAKRQPDAVAVNALDEAIELLRVASKEFEEGNDEQRKIISRTTLGEVIGYRATRRTGQARMRDILEANRLFAAAFNEIDVEKQPRLYLHLISRATVHQRFRLLETERKPSAEGLEKIGTLFEEQQAAFKYMTEESSPLEWTIAIAELGHTLVAAMAMAEKADRKGFAEQSEKAFGAARPRFQRSGNEHQISRIEESEAIRKRLLQ